MQEVRKAQLETKLTVAEQNREKEIQKKLESAKKYVNIYFILKFVSLKLTFDY